MHRKSNAIGICLAALALGFADLAAARDSRFTDNLHVVGYFQAMPLWMSDPPSATPDSHRNLTELRLQNRLNLRWDATPQIALHWQMRTRFFQGDVIRRYPAFKDAVAQDDGLLDLSWTVAEGGDWLLHHIPDRLYVEYDSGDWNLRVGRQRINWGVNLITNPNDLFNLHSPYDFDYPERPGTDAVRIQRHLDFGSRLELAVSPAKHSRDTVAAALYALHVKGNDLQIIGGYYQNRLAGGGGWAGSLGGAGIKAEAMFYADLERAPGSARRQNNLVLASSIDYMFANRLFMVAEALYNQEGGRQRFQATTTPPRPDNPSYSRFQVGTSLAYPVNPLLDASLAGFYYPDQNTLYLSPSLLWSLTQNLDLNLAGQFFLVAQSDSAFADASNLVLISLKYSF